MQLLSIFLFLIFADYSLSTQELTAVALVGGSYHIPLKYEGSKEYTGVLRELFEGSTGQQIFYFCEKVKEDKKKICGTWVDKKGLKIKNANNNVKLDEEGAIITKLGVADSGKYGRYPESEDINQAYLEKIGLYVNEGPTSSPHPTY